MKPVGAEPQPTDLTPDAYRANRLRRATIGDMLSRQASRQPDHPALIYFTRSGMREQLTYQELEAHTNRLARQLMRCGATGGRMVSVMAGSGYYCLVTYFATLKAGAVYTTINPKLTVREVVYHLERTRPVVLVVEEAAWVTAEAAVTKSRTNPQMVLAERGVSQLPNVTIDDLIGGETNPAEPEAIIDESDLAMVIFTSGTEDHPKGVEVPHRNFLIATTPGWAFTRYAIDEDIFLLLAPMYTMAGIGTVTNLVSMGATVVTISRPDPDVALRVISSESVTNLAQTPTFYRRLIHAPGFATADLRTLRQCHVYGGLVSSEVVEAILDSAPDVTWATYWGQTELSQLGSIGFFRSLDDVPGGDLRWIGRPVPQIEFNVVDDNGNDATVGELICRGPAVMPGYFEAPAETARVIREGWLWTGDIVKRDADGNLFFLDRRKDVIKSGGMNVSSLEVERVLAADDTVSEVAVIGVSDPEWTEAVVACIVPAVGMKSLDDPVGHLLARCRRELAAYKVPKAFVLVDELPHDAQGKVRKRAVREMIDSQCIRLETSLRTSLVADEELLADEAHTNDEQSDQAEPGNLRRPEVG